MSATEVVYLYSYSDKRHVADPAIGPDPGYPQWRQALCAASFDTDAEMERVVRSNGGGDKAVEVKRQLPLCKRCARKAGLLVDAKASPADIEGAARQLVRASGALLCDYSGERGVWWDGFRDALLKTRQALGLTDDLTDTDLEARS